MLNGYLIRRFVGLAVLSLPVGVVVGQDFSPPRPAGPDEVEREASKEADAVLDAPEASIEERERVGDGPVEMILIPGINCDWRIWASFMERNADRYTMVSVTLPGMHGTAGPLEDPFEPETSMQTPFLNNAVAAIAEVIEAEGFEKPVIVGHGLGGSLALKFAVDRPEMAGGVVTVEGLPALRMGPRIVDRETRAMVIADQIAPQWRSITDIGWSGLIQRGFESGVEDRERRRELISEVDMTERGISIQYAMEQFAIDLREGLREARPSILGIAACPRRQDPEEVRNLWVSGFAGVDVAIEVLEQTGHFVMEDAPERLDALVAEYVDGLSGDGED